MNHRYVAICDKLAKYSDSCSYFNCEFHIQLCLSLFRAARTSMIESICFNFLKAAVSIQVFFNLNVLEEEVQNLKDSALATVLQAAQSALDIKSLMNQSTDQEKAPKFRSRL